MTEKPSLDPLLAKFLKKYQDGVNNFNEAAEEHFVWMREIIVEAKKQYAYPEPDLLPKTPSASAKRRRCRATADDDNDDDEPPAKKRPGRGRKKTNQTESDIESDVKVEVTGQRRSNRRKCRDKSSSKSNDDFFDSSPKKGKKSAKSSRGSNTRTNQALRNAYAIATNEMKLNSLSPVVNIVKLAGERIDGKTRGTANGANNNAMYSDSSETGVIIISSSDHDNPPSSTVHSSDNTCYDSKKTLTFMPGTPDTIPSSLMIKLKKTPKSNTKVLQKSPQCIQNFSSIGVKGMAQAFNELAHKTPDHLYSKSTIDNPVLSEKTVNNTPVVNVVTPVSSVLLKSQATAATLLIDDGDDRKRRSTRISCTKALRKSHACGPRKSLAKKTLVVDKSQCSKTPQSIPTNIQSHTAENDVDMESMITDDDVENEKCNENTHEKIKKMSTDCDEKASDADDEADEEKEVIKEKSPTSSHQKLKLKTPNAERNSLRKSRDNKQAEDAVDIEPSSRRVTRSKVKSVNMSVSSDSCNTSTSSMYKPHNVLALAKAQADKELEQSDDCLDNSEETEESGVFHSRTPVKNSRTQSRRSETKEEKEKMGIQNNSIITDNSTGNESSKAAGLAEISSEHKISQDDDPDEESSWETDDEVGSVKPKGSNKNKKAKAKDSSSEFETASEAEYSYKTPLSKYKQRTIVKSSSNPNMSLTDSAQKPSNIVSNVNTFIKRATTPTQLSLKEKQAIRQKQVNEKIQKTEERIKKQKEAKLQNLKEGKRKRDEHMKLVLKKKQEIEVLKQVKNTVVTEEKNIGTAVKEKGKLKRVKSKLRDTIQNEQRPEREKDELVKNQPKMMQHEGVLNEAKVQKEANTIKKPSDQSSNTSNQVEPVQTGLGKHQEKKIHEEKEKAKVDKETYAKKKPVDNSPHNQSLNTSSRLLGLSQSQPVLTSYDISDIHSSDSDGEDAPRGEVPLWATGSYLKAALIHQHYHPPDLEELGFCYVEPPNLTVMFKYERKRFMRRTSSAIWDSPLYTRSPQNHQRRPRDESILL